MNHRRVEPGPGQESVWDYPRPPRVEDSARLVQVRFGGVVVAESSRTRRVLETSHPPVYYVPLDDVRPECLERTARSSFCEWKGRALYLDVVVGDRRSTAAAWTYLDPTPAFEKIKGYVAFYPSKVDACSVDGQAVEPQAGDFYGGWVTPDVVGPFKGGAGTWGW